MNEYILPYDAVRTAGDPEQTLMEFLTSTYEAAATTGNGIAPPWNALSACLEFLALLRGRDNGFGCPSPEGELPCSSPELGPLLALSRHRCRR